MKSALRNNRTDSRPLRLESLETRQLMAANITATLSGGVLKVEGTQNNDTIIMRQIGNKVSVDGVNIKGSGTIKKIEILGLGGNDILRLDGNGVANQSVRVAASVWGGSGNDFIVGGAMNDKLMGGADHDTIYGMLGNDSIWGEAGNDLIYGGAGNDQLMGGSGNDRLLGESGNDKIWGEAGNDLLYGGLGNDLLQGGAGDDELLGEAGADSLYGEDGNDWLWGGDGNDTIDGGRGSDVAYGGSGKNTFKNLNDKGFFLVDPHLKSPIRGIGNLSNYGVHG